MLKNIIFIFFLTVCFSIKAAESKINYYSFNGHFYFSDRPLAVLNDTIVYEDSGKPFIVASGAIIRLSLLKPPTETQCIGCMNKNNTPAALLEQLGKK